MYNIPSERKSLDLNSVTGPVVSFPAYLYGGEPFSLPQYACSGPVRDTNQQYFFTNERQSHPQHFSRFTYGFCPNSYCLGIQSRGYVTNIPCCSNDQPEEMAPARFYSYKHVSPFYADNDAYREKRVL
jgi:hypothetical protein